MVLGIDIGGTNTEFAVVDSTKGIVHIEKMQHQYETTTLQSHWSNSYHCGFVLLATNSCRSN